MITINGYTSYGRKYYHAIKETFGKITKAKMDRKDNGAFVLTLVNGNDDKIVFEDCFSAGYCGEGPSGTFEILKDAGFDVTESYIQDIENEKFELVK